MYQKCVSGFPLGNDKERQSRAPVWSAGPMRGATSVAANCKHWFSTSWTEGRRVREGRAWSLQPQAGLLRHVFVTTARFVTKLTKRVKSDAPPARFVTLVTKRAVVTKRAATPAKVSTESASSHARSRRKVLLYQPTNLTQIREVSVPVHLFSEEGNIYIYNKSENRQGGIPNGRHSMPNHRQYFRPAHS